MPGRTRWVTGNDGVRSVLTTVALVLNLCCLGASPGLGPYITMSTVSAASYQGQQQVSNKANRALTRT
jgi:hypothetical protein